MNWIGFIKVFGAILIILYLIIGVDDTIWFILALISGLFHRKEKNDNNLDFDALRKLRQRCLQFQ